MRCPSSVRRSLFKLSTKWPSCPLIGWDIFDFSLEAAQQNSTKLNRKQELNVLYQACSFFLGGGGADRNSKTAAPASDKLRHFRLPLWNHWSEFNETWQQAKSLCTLQSLCFSGRSGNQDGRPGLWFAETFFTSPLKPLNGIQRNLTGSKISTSSTKLVFSMFFMLDFIVWSQSTCAERLEIEKILNEKFLPIVRLEPTILRFVCRSCSGLTDWASRAWWKLSF